MELRLPHIVRLYHVFLENDGKENCDQLLEEECYKMFGIESMNDEHDRSVASMNSLNIHDASNMQIHKLEDAMSDEDYISSPPRFDEKIYYDNSMPLIYDDYIDESGFGRVSTLGSNDSTILEDIESYCDEHESGFGRVSTLFSDDSTILEEFQLIMRKKLLSMMIIVMTCML